MGKAGAEEGLVSFKRCHDCETWRVVRIGFSLPQYEPVRD